MASSHKLLVIQSQDRIVTVQEVGVEDDLDSIVRVVEQLDASNLVQNRVISVIRHVVCNNGWQGVPFQGENAAFQQNHVFLRKKLVWGRDRLLFTKVAVGTGTKMFQEQADSPMEASSVVEQSCTNTVLDFCDRIAQLLGDCLTLECFDSVRMGRGWHNNKGDHRDV